MNKHLSGYAFAGDRYRDSEEWIDLRLHLRERSIEGRANHRPRVVDLHPTAHTVRAAAPTGVNQPDIDFVFGDLLS